MWSKVSQPLGSLVRGLCLITRTMSSAPVGKLSGKVAMVTASTDGIGLALARRLGQDGARVMVSSRKQKNVDDTVKTLQAENLDVAGVTCHVANSEDRTRLVEETLKTFGSIDVLVSNAAVNPIFGPMMETSPDAWDKIFDVNVKSTFFLCKEVVPHMEKNGKGSIVIVSSIAAYAPISLLGAYSVSKTALLGLGKAMAPELAMSNIRVNVVCPGIIKTRFSEALWNNEAALEMVLASIPMKRVGMPEDCSGIVSFLASDDSSYMTGESLMVTGGMTARL